MDRGRCRRRTSWQGHGGDWGEPSQEKACDREDASETTNHQETPE